MMAIEPFEYQKLGRCPFATGKAWTDFNEQE
jgi:hypothetical protein